MEDSSLRVAFDGRKAAMDPGREGAYGRAVISSLARMFPGASFYLYVPSGKHYPLLGDIPGLPNVNICRMGSLRSGLSPFSRVRAREAGPGKVDIFHSLDGSIPRMIEKMPEVRKVVTVHDLSFLSSREGFSWLQRHRYSARVRRACSMADAMAVPSAEVAAGIVRYYFIPRDRITVVPMPSGTGEDSASALMSLYSGLLRQGR